MNDNKEINMEAIGTTTSSVYKYYNILYTNNPRL